MSVLHGMITSRPSPAFFYQSAFHKPVISRVCSPICLLRTGRQIPAEILHSGHLLVILYGLSFMVGDGHGGEKGTGGGGSQKKAGGGVQNVDEVSDLW